VITHRYLFAFFVVVFASNGQAFAQASAESRVDKLEETVRSLERRVSTLEDQLRQRNATPSIPPDKVNWRRIKRGLSEAEVETLLGNPTKVETLGQFTIWYYGERDDGEVQFDGERRTVSGWREP
jgi:outer membrane protein assembly factor BamE (lipoprotein component of BamABCDE complex)